MCQSKKEGGARCFTHAMDDEAEELKNKRDRAKKSGNKEEAKRLHIEFLTTEEGIEELEEKGDLEAAAKLVRRRNQKIDAYNRRYGKNKPHFLPYEQRDLRPGRGKRLPPIWGADGFNMRPRQQPVHRLTGTLWNPQGFNALGIHQETDNHFHPTTGLSIDGYDRAGFSPATGLDRQGYDRDGFDETGFDRNGFSRPDEKGRQYDRKGWNRVKDAPDAWGWLFSFKENAVIHESTGTSLNPQGLTEEQDIALRGRDWRPSHV